MEINFSVEDPEYLVDPMVGAIVLDCGLDREYTMFDCDSEVATDYYHE